jgi:hypothetical protein
MNNTTFYKQRLLIILSIYQISKESNDILKSISNLPADAEGSQTLAKYIKASKINRFPAYLEKILTDIRDIHPNTTEGFLKAQ